jgi:adenylosuccinate lyase
MTRLWSADRKFSTWRRCWLALAEAEKELGLPITDEQLDEMRAHLDDIDYEKAREYERKTRHDVMAHIHAFGDVAPKARPIIHLGATSCYVGDNTDLILIRDGLNMLLTRAVAVLDKLRAFALAYKDMPALGYTHYQPAQVVTVGKRACLWAQDLLMDIQDIESLLGRLRCRGVKGTTGTQASFMALFDNDHGKVRQLDQMVAEKLGFASSFTITGQTYTRKVDTHVLRTLAGLGESAHKFGTDMRLLANMKEVEEPFESTQVGSSAMAYKRNPMRCERICALSRFLMVAPLHGEFTTATQWFERTLDDSANKRLAMSEAFLAADAILLITLNVARGLVVYPAVIAAGVAAELPFMATENVLMAAVKAGGDRQDLHERIRRHSLAAAEQVKLHGRPNDLIQRLKADPAFAAVDLAASLEPRKFIGRAPQQVDEFVAEQVEPIRARYAAALKQASDLKV